jgi:hypothetical protein
MLHALPMWLALIRFVPEARSADSVWPVCATTYCPAAFRRGCGKHTPITPHNAVATLPDLSNCRPFGAPCQ